MSNISIVATDKLNGLEKDTLIVNKKDKKIQVYNSLTETTEDITRNGEIEIKDGTSTIYGRCLNPIKYKGVDRNLNLQWGRETFTKVGSEEEEFTFNFTYPFENAIYNLQATLTNTLQNRNICIDKIDNNSFKIKVSGNAGEGKFFWLAIGQ